MSDRDIWISLLDKAAFMREGVKFCGMIFDKELWIVKDKAVEEFLRGPSALPIQTVLPAPPQARAELRDRFAMAALSGMHARDSYDEGLSTPQQRARLAYIDADAMLAAREENSQ